MSINLDYIKENIDEIGIKEASILLKEWINNSKNPILRKNALEYFGKAVDNGNDFKFLENLFLSDENIEVRLVSGNILISNYLHYKELSSLFEFTLKKVSFVEQKLLAVNGVFPEYNTLKQREYIYTTEVYVVIREDLDRSSTAYQ